MLGYRPATNFSKEICREVGTCWEKEQTDVNLRFYALLQRGSGAPNIGIVSVNYLFGRPLIPSDFLLRIVTSNFRDMRNLMSVVFGLLKMSFWVPKKVQL